jgi:hypothetical protein
MLVDKERFFGDEKSGNFFKLWGVGRRLPLKRGAVKEPADGSQTIFRVQVGFKFSSPLFAFKGVGFPNKSLATGFRG